MTEGCCVLSALNKACCTVTVNIELTEVQAYTSLVALADIYVAIALSQRVYNLGCHCQLLWPIATCFIVIINSIKRRQPDLPSTSIEARDG